MENAQSLIADLESWFVARKECHHHGRFWRNTNQSIPDATPTVVAFSTALDDFPPFSPTFPAVSFAIIRGGAFLVTANVSFADDPSGDRRVFVRKNGSPICESYVRASGIGRTALSCSVAVDCTVGDTIDLVVYQDSGGAINLESISHSSPILTLTRLP